ncbi:adenosine 5'-monophosphoramidase HINT3 [Pseudorasbora parva]|uniref:adenosine 5'-monophosphoramidase HINT3 n=1 Tax=Pseudorasbora parva TaxID=51549 RepID=UPI00351DDF10
MAEIRCSCENEPNSSDDNSDESCIFCRIINGDEPYTQILAEDEDIICFEDIYPAAPHHYLVIPKKHIHSCLSLQADDIGLVRRMAEMGRDVLRAKGVKDFEDISLGFHVPPFITVPHLHLHVLAPFSQIFKRSEEKFTSFWYQTEERFLHELAKKKTSYKCMQIYKAISRWPQLLRRPFPKITALSLLL